MKEDWKDRFALALAGPALGEKPSLDQRVLDECAAYDLGGAAQATLPYLIAPVIDRMARTVADTRLDSPIEEAMLWALVVAAQVAYLEVRITGANEYFGNEPDVLRIEPQAKLGRYRVDFLLTLVTEGVDGPSLIVERDGHDFHERTKEQAAKDRKRDRELQSKGTPVFRFTGSEIWNDPIACAASALVELHDRESRDAALRS